MKSCRHRKKEVNIANRNIKKLIEAIEMDNLSDKKKRHSKLKKVLIYGGRDVDKELKRHTHYED